MTQKAYNFFVGIDISKGHLDYAVLQNNSLIKQGCCQNSAEGIATIISYVKTLSRYAIAKCLFCMEHTGLYTFPLIDCLSKIKARYIVENPLRLKKTLGIVRGKTDQKDAYRIAQYAYKHQHEINCHVELRPPLKKLALLLMLRNKLSLLNLSIKIPLKERRGILDSTLIRQFDQLTKGSLTAVKLDLESVEKEIDDLISEDLELRRLMAIILSVPQIGRVTGIHILLATNEFKNINCPKKFASYAGVAPFPNESGSIKRPSRVSPLANKKMKALLHICALGAIRKVPEIKAYYLRKTEKEGKTKMSVINAVRYKLICRVFSCIRQNRKYISHFQSPLITHT